MSTIKSFDDALNFFPTAAGRPALARIGRFLQVYWGALRDGLAASRAYHELMRRGVPHDVAVHKIFNTHFGA